MNIITLAPGMWIGSSISKILYVLLSYNIEILGHF